MTRTPQQYQERWQRIMETRYIDELADDEDLTQGACVISESAHSTPMGEGMTLLSDFGDAICYYRYYRFPDELEPEELQERSLFGR